MIVSAFAVAVLIAWQVHFIPLIQIGPGQPPLTRQGAFAELLLGAALALLAAGRKRPAAICAGIVFVLAMIVGFEYVLDHDLGIDQLLGSGYITEGVSPRGRISPVAAFSYAACALALLAMCIRRLGRYGTSIAGVLASVLIVVGSVLFLVYVLVHMPTYGWGHFRHISVQASAVLVFLGLGILTLALQESRTKKEPPQWLPVGIGLAFAAGALGIWQALIVHEESQLPLISHIMLAGGIMSALLVAIAVHQAQKATLRSRELQEGKEAFERLFEASLEALLVTDRDGRIVGANQRVESVFGYTRDEILGIPIETLVPIKVRDLHRVHRESYHALLSRRPMGKGLELNARRKGRSEFPVEVSLSPLQSGGELQVLAAVRDITERKQAQEALRLSEELFRGVFETSPLGLALIQLDYRLAKVNPSLCRMSGYSEAELLGMNPFDFTHPDDVEQSKALAERLFRGDIPSYQVEKRYVQKSGEVIWATMTATVLRDQEGRPLLGLGMLEDITERKREQEALRQSEEQFRGVFEQGPLGVTLIGKDRRLFKVNPAFCRMLGYSEAELTRMTPFEFTHPDDQDLTLDRVQRLFTTGAPVQKAEKRYITKSGEVIWGSLNTSTIHDREGNLLYGMGMIEDITDRKRAEEELRTLSQRLSQAIRFASMAVWEWDPRTNSFVWDDTAFEMAGIPKVVPLPYEQFVRTVHPEDLSQAEAALQRVVLKKTQESTEFRVIRPDGGLRHAYAAGGPILDQQGNVTRVVGIAVDITERKRAEEEMRVLSGRLKLATRSASMGVWELSLVSDLAIWDDMMFQIFAIPKKDKITREDWESLVGPEYLAKVDAFLDTILRGKTQRTIEFSAIRTDGSLRHISATGGVVTDKSGNVTGVVGIAQDITERKRAEEELRTLSERLSLATRIASIGVWDMDLRKNMAVWDDASFEMFGMPKVNPVPYNEFVAHIHPDDMAKVQAMTERIARRRTQEALEFRIIRSDGSQRHLSVAAGAALDEHGNAVRVVGIAIDITGRKQLEQDLEAAREQAITAARLSALGMMAGGIAHEINNPLSIIHAMASDMKEMVAETGTAPPQVVARKSSVIRETAERIAKIVRSLRQISREGSTDLFHPTPLAKILAETLEICRAKFKANNVELLLPHVVPEVSVPCREVQIAQALLNLLQNAFDAVLEQETERWVQLEVEPRDGSVSISVIDSGPGIPPDLRSRVMEPFFTTKPVGKGTGLGLSLSKTIAEDHGGRLEYGEERGHTRFSLVLPLARKAEAA